MNNTDEITIPFAKKKLLKALVASIVFVLLGLWIVIYKPEVSNGIFNEPLFKYGMAVASIVFFGAGIVYFTKRLLDNKPGLIINDEGITDHSGINDLGHIPWSDVTSIITTDVFTQQFLMVIVRNPEEYINKQRNVIKRKGMQSNYKKYGSPIAISTNALKCSLDELKNLLYERLIKFENS